MKKHMSKQGGSIRMVLSVLRETARALFSPVVMLMVFSGGFVFCLFGAIVNQDFGCLLAAISAAWGAYAAADSLFEMQNYYRDCHDRKQQ